jgi:tripartite-type tricarboxylate transporter receptor subunit TctC
VVTSLLAGDVQVTLNTPGLMQPFVKAGKVKVLAIVGKRRSPLLDAPTLKEAGFEPPILSWVGMTAPAGTPKDIILKINTEVGKLLADPKFVERVLTPVSVDPTGGTPEEFGEFMRIDRDNAAKVARMANLKME